MRPKKTFFAIMNSTPIGIVMKHIIQDTSKLSLLNRVPCVPYVPTCQKRANFSFLRANAPTCRETCQRAKACQCFNLACQRAKKRAIFSTSLAKWCANFQLFFKRTMFFYIPNEFIPNIFYIF